MIFWLWYCSWKSCLTIMERGVVQLCDCGRQHVSLFVRNIKILKVLYFTSQNQERKYHVCPDLSDFSEIQRFNLVFLGEPGRCLEVWKGKLLSGGLDSRGKLHSEEQTLYFSDFLMRHTTCFLECVIDQEISSCSQVFWGFLSIKLIVWFKNKWAE